MDHVRSSIYHPDVSIWCHCLQKQAQADEKKREAAIEERKLARLKAKAMVPEPQAERPVTVRISAAEVFAMSRYS